MAEVFNLALTGALAVIGVTFLVGFFKTLLEGPEAIAAFDRAGFTWGNYRRGKLPSVSEGGSSAAIGNCAEIEIVGNEFKAEATRTVVKEHS